MESENKIQRNYNKLQALFNSSKSSTNDSTLQKLRANSKEGKNNVVYKNHSKAKRAPSKENLHPNIKKAEVKVPVKQLKISHQSKGNETKHSQKVAGVQTSRNRVKRKEMARDQPAVRARSEEQKFDDLILNEVEPEQDYDPNIDLEEERDRLVRYNKQYAK